MKTDYIHRFIMPEPADSTHPTSRFSTFFQVSLKINKTSVPNRFCGSNVAAFDPASSIHTPHRAENLQLPPPHAFEDYVEMIGATASDVTFIDASQPERGMEAIAKRQLFRQRFLVNAAIHRF